ncbi:MAG: UDP-4-amino-4,6-dideoxy-N-acetyl-beta-L-altrosamine N-acetyltransferase [Candidatus Zixiibacteriota bacterium]
MLKMRKIKINDLKLIMEWRMQPDVTKYMYTDPVLTIEGQRLWLQKISADESVRYWIINLDGVDIGVLNLVNIDNVNKRCAWAYYIGFTESRGKGLGRQLECNVYDYVFNKLGMEKLCCEVFAFNEKVVQIHEHFGSRREGYFRKHIQKNGEWYDVVAMAILKEEWVTIKNGIDFIESEFE